MQTIKQLILQNGAEIITEIIHVPGSDGEPPEYDEPFILRNPFQIVNGVDKETGQRIYGLQPLYTYQTAENSDSEMYAWSIAGISNPSIKLATWYIKLAMNVPSESAPSVDSTIIGSDDEGVQEERGDSISDFFDSDGTTNIIDFKSKMH